MFVASTVLEVVRSFSSAYFPNTWQLALGLFLLFVIRFLPRGLGSLVDEGRHADEPRCSKPSGVSKRFGAVVAAADIDIAVAAGERVSLIGSNGAGKTTFVNMITGYLKPDDGPHPLDGRDITRAGAARDHPPRRGALVPDPAAVRRPDGARQHAGRQRLPRPAPELLAAGAPRRGDRRAPTRCWSAFGLAEHRERRVAELPGGVRKLLDIAMALTAAPKLLLLDEPTSGVTADEKFPMMDTVMAALGQARR